ncbi:sensor histidine kinase [Kineococcus aurantiacus]|uniref:Sensor-like histidine kinase SenX3 n=1 Tax=Kineococcus aurantiacus TaxID=37633 RepID=A0A7Y9J2U7_9ACTN|nr:GAF domain-containing sensor histidine kinase [Kineococcus aurantiacus]NYD24636.1 signal transduction histidine kinase [Kineococcus aurantiacus]
MTTVPTSPAPAPVPAGGPRPLPPHREAQRVAALRGYGLLDRPGDPELDAVVRIAASLAGVPTATVNLIDAHRQCQLSAVGFRGAASDRLESLCARNLGDPDVVVVPDARADARYRDSAWVDGRLADVVFYASAPLVSPEGHHLGSLCVFDTVRHDLTGEQVQRLRDLAGVVVALLERHRRHREQAVLAAEVEEQRELAQLTLAELERREEFTLALLDSVDVAVVACDATGRLTVFNPTARRLHGLVHGPDGSSGAAHRLLAVDGTPLADGEVPLRRALAGEAVRGVEVLIAPRDGDPVRVVCTGRALHDAAGTVIGAVVAMQDVTADRAHVEALERAGEQLRRSNDELANLAAVASHDLAAPLTAVVGYLELLLDVHTTTLGPEGAQWAGTALRAAQRMQGLIEAVLEHARADSTGLVLQPVAVRDVLSHVVEDLGTAAAPSRITYAERGAGPGGAPAHVRADPVLLRQLLQNLVGNAVRYRDPARASHVEVAVRDLPTGGWELTVADNGRGIPAAQREQVFAMFAVAGTGGEGTGAQRRPGHGIGLATCQRIVERHGGRIAAEPTPGGGATLRATFPAVGQTGDRAGVQPGAGAVGGTTAPLRSA